MPNSFDPISQAPPIIAGFLAYMQTIKGKSQNTINEYYCDLRTFFRYIKLKKQNKTYDYESFEKISIDDINLDLIKSVSLMDVYEYMNFTIVKRNNSSATRARKSSSLRSFFKYLTCKTKELSVNPVEELETPKIKKALPKYLTFDQSKKLLSVVSGKFAARDYCILTLLLNCGLRLSELVALNYTDISSNDILTITGKGSKQRIVYLNEACVEAINNYLKVRSNAKLTDTDSKKALFISRLNKRMGRQAIQVMVKKYLSQIGLRCKGYSVHKLRHTAATLMYQYANVDIRVLKDILGHENLGTTEIYTHLSSDQIKNATEKNPLSKVRRK